MIKRIEQWLASIFRRELAVATAEIAALRAELAQVHAELKEHTVAAAKDVQTHTESVAADIKTHAEETVSKITADAKAIIQFQTTARLGCSYCGQLTRAYILDPETKKVKCTDCQKKGVA